MKKIDPKAQRTSSRADAKRTDYPEPLAMALSGRESSGPSALLESYPRIIERLAELWGDKVELDKYVHDLVFSERVDERKGFEPEMLQDIFFMKELHDAIQSPHGVESPLDRVTAAQYDNKAQTGWSARSRLRSGRMDQPTANEGDEKSEAERSTPWNMEAELMRVKAKMEMRRLGKMKFAQRKVGEILLEKGCITDESLKSALAMQASSPKKVLIGSIITHGGYASEADVQRALCVQQGTQLIDLDKIQIDPSVAGKIPRDIEKLKKLVAVAQNSRTILVASAHPIDFAELDWLGFLVGQQVEMAWASANAIERKLAGGNIESREKKGSEASDDFKRIAKAAAKPIAERKARESAVFELTKKGPVGAEDPTIGDMVKKILIDAKNFSASDIHIESSPKSKHSSIRMRIDGELTPYAHFDKAAHEAVVSRIKISADMDISERRRPQDGKMAILDAKEGRIEARVSCIPAVGGFEAITLRLINAAEPVPLDQIGADLEQKTMLDQLLASPHGLLLVCGPTGSGKTTTLHSMLSQLNTPGRKIWTVEDPVEIVQDGLVQTQAMPKIGYGFDTALRAFMRADPDVIMVGEVRDAATASAALEASLTGHFVLTTLHTNSACESAVRMLDLGADQFALADAIRGIVAQRLARKLCSCSYKRDATQQEIDEMAREHFTAMGEPRSSRSDRTRWLAETTKRQGRPIEVREPVGCDLCRGSGHKGRVGILEVLPASQAVKKALSNKESAADLLRIALSEGFKPLRARAIELACAGVISLSEARGISL